MATSFSGAVRRAISLARYEAGLRGMSDVRTECLLLALLRQRDPEVLQLLGPRNSSVEDQCRRLDGSPTPLGVITARTGLPLSADCQRVLELASAESARTGRPLLGAVSLILGMMSVPECRAAEILRAHGVEIEDVRRLAESARTTPDSGRTRLLAQFGRDLTALAAAGELDPLIGRDRELLRLIQILSRRRKNNAILLGDPGVGKTAIVEGLAQKIADRNVPRPLAGRKIISLQLSSIVAGSKYRGEFEDRLQGIVDELRLNRDHIVFIDEIHTLIETGSAGGTLDAANILKPVLSRGEISCIGATTGKEFRRHIERDRALLRRFQSVTVPAASPEETLAILRGTKGLLERFHGVRYSPDALEAAVRQSDRFITDRQLPDKAIDVLDEAGVAVWIGSTEEINDGDALPEGRTASGETPTVTNEHVDRVVSILAGVPVSRLQAGEAQRLRSMEKALARRVVGQDEAVRAVSRAIRRSRMGLGNPTRPLACLLFLGPQGVGKTELAKQIAEFLFQREDALIRLDMSEYSEPHSVSKIIGSPPGYVGHEDGGQISEQIRRKPYSVVLLDEFEKAHGDIWSLMLQVLDEGRLTDADGNPVNFRNTVLLMTSNVGGRFAAQTRQIPGFRGAKHGGAMDRETKRAVLEEARRVFSPEFLDRLDEIVVFKPLGSADLTAIVDLMLEELNERLRRRDLAVRLSPPAKRWLLAKADCGRRNGARNLHRTLQRFVQDPLSEILIGDEPPEKTSEIVVTVRAGKLRFRLPRKDPAGAADAANDFSN